MPNKSNNSMTPAKQRFIEDVARLLVPWGVPQTAARLYGYMLLSAEPVSLDRITTDLEMSKSSASVAARLLEQYTLARRHGERGSKRALYEVSDNYKGMLIEQNRLLDALAELLEAGAGDVASGRARDRLKEMAEFYLVTRQAMESRFAAGGKGGEHDKRATSGRQITSSPQSLRCSHFTRRKTASATLSCERTASRRRQKYLPGASSMHRPACRSSNIVGRL